MHSNRFVSAAKAAIESFVPQSGKRQSGFMPGQRMTTWTARVMAPVVAAACVMPVFVAAGCGGSSAAAPKVESVRTGHAVSSEGRVRNDSFKVERGQAADKTIEVPTGTKILVIGTAGADAALTASKTTFTSPSGSGTVVLSGGKSNTTFTTLEGTPTEAVAPNTVIVRKAEAAVDEANCSDCSLGNIETAILNPTPGEWRVSLGASQQGYELHTMAIVGEGPKSLAEIQSTGEKAAAQVGSEVITRGGCNWFVRTLINRFCAAVSPVLGTIGAGAIIGTLNWIGLGWIVNNGVAVDFLLWVCRLAANRGCNWLGDQVCSRIR